MTSREQFERFRDTRNALLEAEGHKPGSKWHVTQAHYATWEAALASTSIVCSAAAEQCAHSSGHSDCYKSAKAGSQYCSEHSCTRRHSWSD